MTIRAARIASWYGVIVLLLVQTDVFAQDSTKSSDSENPHAVQPERPTVATHAGTVTPGWIEIEGGIERDRFSDGSLDWPTPILFKLGVTGHVQADLFIPQISLRDRLKIGAVAVGVKWRVMDDAPLLGDFAVQPSLQLSTVHSSGDDDPGTTDFTMLLISSHTFADVAMDLNVGYTVRTGEGTAEPKSSALWTASFGGPFGAGYGWTLECFGIPGTSGSAGALPIIAILAGPTFLAREWLAFDAGAIVPLVGPQPWAVYAGVVWNVGRVW